MNLSDQMALEQLKVLKQSIKKILHCMGQLTEEQVWWRPDRSQNSIGNLVLHICGNLKQWTRAALTDEADDRQRQAEFDQRDLIPKTELTRLIRETESFVALHLMGTNPNNDSNLVLKKAWSEADWLKLRNVQGFEVTVLEAIIHTVTHFAGHTHQIILLTRLQLGEKYQFDWTPESDQEDVPI